MSLTLWYCVKGFEEEINYPFLKLLNSNNTAITTKKQAGATGALLDSVGCSTKLFGRQKPLRNRLCIYSRALFVRKSDIRNDQATKEALQQKSTPKNKHQKNKNNYCPQIVSLL